MVLTSTTLGLFATAALLSLYKMPSVLLPDRHKPLSQSQLHKRYFPSAHIPQRQYLEPPPPRFSLESFVNRIFRRPPQADVRPALYRRQPNVWHKPPPVWHSAPQAMLPVSSDAHAIYSNYGMPMANGKGRNKMMPPFPAMFGPRNHKHTTTTTTKPSVNKHWGKESKSVSPLSKQTISKKSQPKMDEHNIYDEDDDYDDDSAHYYHGDTDNFDDFSPFHSEEDTTAAPDSDIPNNKATNSKQGKSVIIKNGPNLVVPDKETNKDNSIRDNEANSSKTNYAILKNRRHRMSSTSTTTVSPGDFTKDCSPSPRLNYHYHMYMVKPVGSAETSNLKMKTTKKTTSLTTTAPLSGLHPVYSVTSVPASGYKNQVSSPDIKVSSSVETASTIIGSVDNHKLDDVFSPGSKESNSEYYYQVVTSQSYLDPPSGGSSYVELTDSGNHKSHSHLNSDYYNSVLLQKILGLNPNAKAMPLENYATESNPSTAPLTKFDKIYKNTKSIDTSKVLHLDDKSKLYVTLGKSSDAGASNIGKNGPSKKQSSKAEPKQY